MSRVKYPVRIRGIKSMDQLNRLRDIADIIMGSDISKADYNDEGKLVVIKPDMIMDGKISYEGTLQYCNYDVDQLKSIEESILKDGDIIVSVQGEIKVALYKQTKEKCIVSDAFLIVRSQDSYPLFDYLTSITARREFERQLTQNQKLGNQQIISIQELGNLVVPSKKILYGSEAIMNARDLEKSVGKQFENEGWKVIYDYGERDIGLDIALFQGELLVAGVEVKTIGLSRLKEKNMVIQKCKSTMDYYGLEVFYCFLEEKLYALKDTCLIEQSEFPTPVPKKEEDKIYTEIMQNGFLFKNVDNSVGNVDMKFIIELFSKLDKKIDLMSKVVNNTQTTVNETKEIVLEIKENLSSMIFDIEKYKKTSLEIEDKIGAMMQCIDANMKKIDLADIEFYNWTVKNWLSSNYENIEPQSKMYLPSAEYLYDALCKMKEVDFSPFILQYCRSLECEILQKLFRAFVKDVKAKGYNVTARYADDLEKNELNHQEKPTYKFATSIKKYMVKEENQWSFELGTMQFVMNLVANGNNSPILNDFKTFIEEKFNSSFINHEYVSELKDITKNYRNKSAHPDYISFDDAQKGKEEIRKALNEFLDNYKMQ